MIKKIKKTIAFVSMSLVMTMIPVNSVFAVEYGPENSLMSLAQIGPDGEPTFASPDKVIRDTYWADLEEKTLTNINGKEYYGVFPKYVLKPDESALKNLGIRDSGEGSAGYLPSTGITETEAGMKIIDPVAFYRFGYLVGEDTYGPPHTGRPETDPIPDRVNPFGFVESDLLTQEEIKDPRKLTVFADIGKKGSSNSKEIGEYKVGEEINLDFSIDASWFKRFVMGYTLDKTRTGYMSGEDIQSFFNETRGKLDAQIVYTIDIPKNIEVKNPSATLTGLEGFNVKTEVKNNADSKTLVISLRLKDDKQAKVALWKNTIEKLKTINTSNIKVSISGLSVGQTAKPEDKITLRGTASGYFEWGLSKYFPLSSTGRVRRATDNPDRIYLYFVGKQSNEGRDANAPTDKPNLISYTFKVKSTPSNPGGGGGGGTTPDPGRVDGDDRVETGIEISKKYYDKAKTVIVVRHDLFPDSMTASVLAKLKDAPILLNPTNKLDPRVGAEIKRLGAEEVIIVGGPDSISEKVRGDLKAYDKDKDVERIAGVDRYGTSEMVARRVTGITGKKNTGVIASGQVFPDALSVGTFASRDGYPILLVKKNLVPDQVVRAIKDLEIKKTYIAGGTNTISKSTEAKLPGVLERMAGKDRYETSVAIAKSKFKDSREAFIASGEEFADALVISPVSGKYNRPTLLASRNKKTNAVVKKYIEESYLTSITAIGGEKHLPKSVILDLVGK